MRWFSTPFLLSLALVVATGGLLPGEARGNIDSELEAQIERYIKGLRARGSIRSSERTAWVVQDLTSGRKLASINEDTSLQAASMIKPYLALAFFHQVREGRLIYGPESKRHMELMIQKSNNPSTNWVMRQTGGPAATQALLKRGNWKEVMPLAFQNSQIENDEAFEDAHFVWRPVGLSSAVSLLSLTLLRVTTDWKSELRLIRFHWYHTLLFV